MNNLFLPGIPYCNCIIGAGRKMRKFVVLFILPLILFCGCTGRASGNAGELTRCDWSATLGGGGELRLSFDDGSARLEIKNGGESAVIEGRMIAGEDSFVIFDSDLGQNYAFEYVPRGEKLDLTYGGDTVEMTAE